jgi:3D (Asp-Asp-Asp) domain-containing protein/uncharacterized protein YoxC
MLNSEVSGEMRPLKSGRMKSGSGLGMCLFLISILLVLVSVLVINTLVISGEYRQIKSKADSTSEKLDMITKRYESLLGENESLLRQNEMLSAKYEEIAMQNEKIIDQMHQINVINERLTRENRELAEDNIALQNSLKMAASAGIKPQNYEEFKGISSRGAVDRGRYIGSFLGTAYTPSKEECGNNKGITNSGYPIIPGVSIAVDTNYWPFGTVFYIKGLGYAVAMDTGSAIKGKYRFDFSVFDRKFARALGSRHWEVYLVKLGKGRVEKDSIV